MGRACGSRAATGGRGARQRAGRHRWAGHQARASWEVHAGGARAPASPEWLLPAALYSKPQSRAPGDPAQLPAEATSSSPPGGSGQSSQSAGRSSAFAISALFTTFVLMPLPRPSICGAGGRRAGRRWAALATCRGPRRRQRWHMGAFPTAPANLFLPPLSRATPTRACSLGIL